MSASPLRIGLLQCGHIAPEVASDHGDYPEAFAELLAGSGIELVTYDVTTGPPPQHTDACEGWLVSGSASSAYEPLAWIPPLEDFLRAAVADEAPMVAVCFGHQVLAQAMGGRVAKAEAGWGVGAHDYEIVGEPAPWMVDLPASHHVRLIASHQDQVVELPEGATIVARTDHCPVAAYTLGPAALAIQPHPEFSPEVSRGLVERRYEVIGQGPADDALASLDQPTDRALVGRWIARFLRGGR